MKNKKLKFASLFSLFLFSNISFASTDLSELAGVEVEADPVLEKRIVFIPKDIEFGYDICASPEKNVYSCEKIKGNSIKIGVIESFDPIYRDDKSQTYNYIPILFNDGEKGYLKISRDTDIKTIYGDSSQITKFSQYKEMIEFKPEPLVNGSNVVLVKKEFAKKYSGGKKEDEKNLAYITDKGVIYNDYQVDNYRFVYNNFIKNSKVIDMLRDLNLYIDKLDNKIYIHSNNYNDYPFSPRVVYIGDKLSLVGDVNYNASSWLFIESMNISVDGKLYNFDKLKFDREVLSGGITETSLITLGEPEIEMLKNIIKSKNSFVRFNGRKYYNDIEITKEAKQQILEILKVYYLSKNTK